MTETIEQVNARVRESDPNCPASPSGERTDEFSGTMAYLLENGATHSFIEIGIHTGSSFGLWSHYFDGIKIAIDTNAAPKVVKDTPNTHTIRGNSHEPNTIKKVAEMLDGEKVDWLFIDGDHGPGVEDDYDDYKKFVKPGGYIGFHDILHRGHSVIGQLWHSLEGEKAEMTLGCGIGILQVPKDG